MVERKALSQRGFSVLRRSSRPPPETAGNRLRLALTGAQLARAGILEDGESPLNIVSVFESECFFITPIGGEGTEIRERSDGVLDVIVRPAAEAAGLTAVRADEIGTPGQITTQVIDHVLNAKAAVADLTGANPNVYYELGVRHAARLPVVLISEEPLAFDIAQQRTIFFDRANLKSVGEARRQVGTHLQSALDGGDVESPISTAVDWRALREGGTDVERTLAEIVTGLEELRRAVLPTTYPVVISDPVAVASLDLAYQTLSAALEGRSDKELEAVMTQLEATREQLSKTPFDKGVFGRGIFGISDIGSVRVSGYSPPGNINIGGVPGLLRDLGPPRPGVRQSSVGCRNRTRRRPNLREASSCTERRRSPAAPRAAHPSPGRAIRLQRPCGRPPSRPTAR